MKITGVYLVIRYKVEFDEEETTYLKSISFLHPAVGRTSSIDITEEEYQMLYQLPCFTKDALDTALKEARKDGASVYVDDDVLAMLRSALD